MILADYRTVVPYIVWPWFAVLMVVLFRRALAKRRTPPAPPESLDEELARTGAIVPTPTPRPPTDSPPPSVPTPPRDRPPPNAVPPPPAPPTTVASTTGAPPPVVPHSIFDPEPSAPDAARRTIAEIVEGIELPLDLTPLVGTERPVGARETVAFVTRAHDATEVGRAVGEELRRLGFELMARQATEVIATRDADVLVVTVHPDVSIVERGDRPAFPGAGEGGVVVEFVIE